MLTRRLWRSFGLSQRLLASYPPYTKLTMPALSPTMTEGNLAKWHVQEGDEFNAGDALAEIETDKASLDYETVDDGYIAKILMPDGSNNVEVNTPIAIAVEEKEDIAAFANFKLEDEGGETASTPAAAPLASEPTPTPAAAAAPVASSTSSGERNFASPLARNVASEQGVDISQISGSGFGGRVIAADVREHQPAPQAAAQTTAQASAVASSTGEFEDIPHTAMRKVIAERLVQSKQTIPHYYLTVEINADNILSMRSDFNKKLEKSEKKLSVNDFIVKAAAASLRSNPEVNSSWHDTFIRRYDYVDISVAVSTPAGLITPIVADADRKGLTDISDNVKDLATRARENKLLPHEYQGGTFTISNLGMFGVNEFSAIINPPQAAILAIGAAEKKIVPGSDDGEFKVINTFNVTLSCDHRVIDGAVGAQWLKSFKNYCEDPVTLLL